jgi:hypothetical protein
VQVKISYIKSINFISGSYPEQIDATEFERGIYVVDFLKKEIILMTNRMVKN